jgi:glycosyltransferase involved in cell wall biosynthesis
MSNNPDISIALITYKHELFVSETLKGIALQNFSGTIEIVIGDDCSPDDTRKLLEEFANANSNVRLLFHKKNIGMVGNWTSVLSACRGKYIAVCEGDDYWTASEKLQQQFDFLENNKDFSMCWHPVKVLNEGIERPYPYDDSKEISDISDLILYHYIPTCSLFFRNNLIQSWPSWIYKARSFDIILEMLIGINGKAKCIDKLMGTYRQHPEGVSKSDQHLRLGALSQLYILKKFNSYSCFRYDDLVRKKMNSITVYQLKRADLQRWNNLLIRFRLLFFHLYATKAKTLKAIRHEIYLHLIPNLYFKFKKYK